MKWISAVITLICLLLILSVDAPATELVGVVVDAETNDALPARVYVKGEGERWFFVESAAVDGSALPYREQWVPMPQSVEKHTTASAHPFRIDLEPGEYEISIVRGKEYFPLSEKVVVGDQPLRKKFRLVRWINMAERGWYSGETHVHRRIEELPNVMLAEDLNVAFPVTFWTVNAFEAPGLEPSPLRSQGPSPFGDRKNRGRQMIAVDSTHVIFPRNTEYEVFSINGRRHTLGAVFILNHKSVFRQGMPPVAEIAEQAHREGALLDLDKHSWPWSMMLVPIAKIDLYELANNSVWRTEFGFRRSATDPASYMKLESDDDGLTEWGWLDFGFQNYYTLLNCGFRLRPTAGTASGVHPVPLGFSRVYVHIGDHFESDNWISGLRRGRSFVTTGPMLFATLDGQHPGHKFEFADPNERSYRLHIESVSPRPIDRIEVVVNGEIQRTLRPETEESKRRTSAGAYELTADVAIPIKESSWVAVRSFHYESSDRIRFAHTAPWHVDVAGQPVRPRKREVEFLIRRVRDEIARNEEVLSEPAIAEFKAALAIYEGLLSHATTDN
jgi:hypothetical protein